MNTKTFKLAQAEARRQLQGQDYTESEFDEAVDEVLHDWRVAAAEDMEMFGEPMDTDCFESGRDNCDDWGTGEGAHHGRI
jgi:hypothetical protein